MILTYAHQKTIVKSVSLQGIGVHSGVPVTLSLHPLSINEGVVFERSDLEENNVFHLNAYSVTDTRFCTTITNEHGVTLATIEHLMAALAAFGITNVLVRVDAPEMPIMDGSARAFIALIQEGGIKTQKAPTQVLKILKPVEIRDGNRWIRFEPASGFTCDFEIDFQGRQGLHAQSHTFKMSPKGFDTDISGARSFGFLEDAEKLYAMGLAKGSSLDNAVVIDQGDVMNPDGLRHANEMVRHKILDAIGDFYLSGYLFEGRCLSFNSGHEFNNRGLRALLEDTSAWTLTTYQELEASKPSKTTARPSYQEAGAQLVA